mmetsp:Transcript_8785/g.13556  ORF Transcript_8785/g.13556 Transcript_8785/m.13556 type:complete len:184 (+) Transcript_8785:1709-2260(+)
MNKEIEFRKKKSTRELIILHRHFVLLAGYSMVFAALSFSEQTNSSLMAPIQYFSFGVAAFFMSRAVYRFVVYLPVMTFAFSMAYIVMDVILVSRTEAGHYDSLSLHMVVLALINFRFEGLIVFLISAYMVLDINTKFFDQGAFSSRATLEIIYSVILKLGVALATCNLLLRKEIDKRSYFSSL